MNKKHVIGYAATAIVAMGIGSAAGPSGGTTGNVSATPAATVTSTVTAASPASTVPGPTVTATVEVSAVRESKRIVTLRTECHNTDGVRVISGEAIVKVS